MSHVQSHTSQRWWPSRTTRQGTSLASPDGVDYHAAAVETCEYRLDAMACYMQIDATISNTAKELKVTDDCAAFIVGAVTIAKFAIEYEDLGAVLKAAQCECDDPAPCNDVRT